MFSLLFVTLFAVLRVQAWTTCDEQEFCNNIRYGTESHTYSLEEVTVAGGVASSFIVNDGNAERFLFRLTSIEDDILRLTIQDLQNSRYTPEKEALDGEPTLGSLLESSTDDEQILRLTAGDNLSIDLYRSPFKMAIYRGEDLIVTVNNNNGLVINTAEDDKSLALDIAFPLAQRAYGIPQHAERLSLPTTTGEEQSPFRMFNVDYYGYPAFTREALYGAIGALYGVSTGTTTGVFWMNAAQTFVDIRNTEGEGVEAKFISETGALELFVLGGPTLRDSVRQFTALTGVGDLPQYYNLGYHQSRYSYMSQEDVETVVEKFDEHDFPMDTIWLDIDYTDGYRYFTWNYDTFPNPLEMQTNVVATGRKLVAISDPHFKVDEEYFVYKEAIEGDFFIKYENGTVFEGQCWPNVSSYIDFFDPAAQEWYADLYLPENFVHTTTDLFIWNDMNEPSVFEAVDQTLPPEVKHFGGWEHRDVHNLYGFKQTQATKAGLLKRDPERRPFVLTRAHFAGSQRYAAMWTGDNQPTWEHLKISIPMLLTESLAGMAFSGADVGGFTDNVAEDLLQRWYQVGAWYPFFRGHSGTDTDRREPYLYNEDIQERVRSALRTRYRHIPYWYTLFFEHELTGDPIMRPLSYHYPQDLNVFDIDTQFLIGSDIMVAPVLEESVTTITTYFPGGAEELWYDLVANTVTFGTGNQRLWVTLDSAPYYYRGGSIILTIDDNVRHTQEQRGKPYHMHVLLNSAGEAYGTFYLDDWQSFEYRDNKEYIYYRFEYKEGRLSVVKIHEDSEYDATFMLSQIDVYRVASTNARSGVAKANVTSTVKDIHVKNLRSETLKLE